MRKHNSQAANRLRAGRRPGSDTRVREDLLEAAQHLFATQGYEAVTLARVAEAAGVTSAMVRYYFGDKQGLYEAVTQQTLQPMLQRVRQLLDSKDTPDLGSLLGEYMRFLATNPWIPRLVMREALSRDGRFREHFISHFAESGRGLIAEAIRRSQAAGTLRADLVPEFTAMSLVSMAVFPFAALPLTSSVFGVGLDEETLDKLIDNTSRILCRGVLA